VLADDTVHFKRQRVLIVKDTKKKTQKKQQQKTQKSIKDEPKQMQERFEDEKRVTRAINRRKTDKEVTRAITDNQENWVIPSVHV
jgi:5'-3' exonuclease